MNQSLLTAYDLHQVMKMAVATGLFSSLASFTKPPDTQGPTGNPIGPQVPVSGLQSIVCVDAPESILRPSVNEAKSIPDIQSQRERHVLLGGNYPTLRDAAGLGWQCSITDPNGNVTLYDLLGAEPDSQATQTRCKLQKVTL